jgi:large subunit ribosomal protein L6
MSRIGKVPVSIPEGVNVSVEGQLLQVSGKRGSMSMPFKDLVSIVVEGQEIIVRPVNDTKQARAMWGLYRSIANHLVIGVSKGFETKLEINGVGYRASVNKNILTLLLGYSHEIKYLIPKGISIVCEKPTLLVVSGHDKQLVGQVCATIVKMRPPEPYKGKGIKYEGQKIRRKEGKKK